MLSYLGTGTKMGIKNVFEHTYQLLKQLSVVDTKAEFCRTWLGRNESYFRCLRYNNKQPSTQTLAVLSNKLRHYSNILQQANSTQSQQIAAKFASLSNQCDNYINRQAKDTWIKLMEANND